MFARILWPKYFDADTLLTRLERHDQSVHLWSKAFLIRKDYRNHFRRNQNESNEETEERDCKSLCFFDVTNDIDTELGMCSIKQKRTRRRISEFQTEQPLKRLMGGKTVFSGSLSYVVRLTFQSFDQYHSDSQDLFRNSYIRQEFADQNRLVPDRTRKNLGPEKKT